MKILITAFEAFDNNDINYSNEILKNITDFDGVTKLVLPVEYYNSFKKLEENIVNYKPDIIILLGEARSYNAVGFEVIGINELSKKPDNAKLVPNKRYIIDGEVDGIFSTLDYDLFKEAFEKANAKHFRSFSAGTYVCNALLYQTLLYLKQNESKIKCGFIHIPKLENDEMDVVIQGINNYIKSLI